MQVFLETDRLVLRQFTMADADNLVNLDADPDVMRFVTGGIPTSREEIQDEFLPAFLGYYQRYQGYGFWAAIEKATGEFLGWFHFRPRVDAAPGEVELGYRLRKSAWGKGYATEGSRALIRKGFTEYGVQRVVAEAMAVNQASRRVMEKAGLTLVRTFHQPWPYPIDGDQFGGVEYALDKTGWQQDIGRRQRPAGLSVGLLDPELGYAVRASAGPARTQARPAAPAGGPQAGQPGAIGQQLGDAAGPRNGDDRPDPAAGQRQPLPRSICRGVVRHATHDRYFPSVLEARHLLARAGPACQPAPLPDSRGRH